MSRTIAWAALALVTLVSVDAAAQTCLPSVVKVPCRDMGDGRTLIDSLYLPDSFVMGKNRYTIIHTRPASMTGEWANLVCTLRLS
jgi:hypothetical protein